MSEHDHEHDHVHDHDAEADSEAEVRRRFAVAQIRQYGDVVRLHAQHDVANPVLGETSGEPVTDEEGCLSLQGVRVPVERQEKLVLSGKDENGEVVRYELEGYGARVAQHELDHLDGVLIIDRTDDEHRKEALAVLRPRAVLR